MPLHDPLPELVELPPGFAAAGIACGLKKAGALDLGLLLADRAVAAAALFTNNELQGAHIAVCREHLLRSGGVVRAILVNARNANCATGEQGREDARRCCRELALRLDCPTEHVLMASTGPIGAPLPTQRIVDHLDALVAAATPDGGMAFARAIMTTDTHAKAANVVDADGSHVTGFAKGSGMIHPDMATMLGFLLSDGSLPADPEAARNELRRVADHSFHRVTVDGDTSPNDSLFLLARGTATELPARHHQQLVDVSQRLARMIAADGEGATRLIEVHVAGARDETEARTVGRVIATSPLVKTAVAGRDPNWGRILSAAGRSGVPFDPDRARVWVGSEVVFFHGVPHPEREGEAHRHLATSDQVLLGIDLGIGDAEARIWSCDLTADYVRINADYRS